MFGRPVEAPRTSRETDALSVRASRQEHLIELSQRPVPPGLGPWLIPLLVVFSAVVFAVLAVAVAATLLVVVLCVVLALIGLRRYRFVKSHDNYVRPRNEALFKDLNAHLPRRTRRDREL